MTISQPKGWQLSFRKFAIALTIIATVVLATGLVGFWRLMASSPVTSLRPAATFAPESVTFVPKQALAAASLLVSPEQLLTAGQQLLSPQKRQQALTETQALKASLRLQTGLDYDTDIQPWIGDQVTIAITDLDIDRDPRNGRQVGYLVAIAAQDGDRAKEFLELFWQRQALAGTTLTLETIDGVRIIYAQDWHPQSLPATVKESQSVISEQLERPNRSLATAIVGNRFVLVANHPQVIQRSIRSAQAPDLNLTTRPDYQQALANGPQDYLGLTYINLPQTIDWFGLAQPQLRTLGRLSGPSVQTLIASWAVNRQGLRLKTALSTATTNTFEPRVPHLTQPVEPLQILPREAIFVAAGENLSQLWSDIETELQHYTALPLPLKQWQQASQTLVGRRLKAWLTGSYAAGCLPAGDCILVAERTAPAVAALTALDQFAQQQALNVGPLSIERQQVTTWSRLRTTIQGPEGNRETMVETEVLGVHTRVGAYEIFANSLPAMTAALRTQRKDFAQTDTWKRVLPPLAYPNEGIAQLDWSGLAPLLQPLPLIGFLQTSLQPFLDNLQTLTVTSYGGDDAQRQGDILIQLAG